MTTTTRSRTPNEPARLAMRALGYGHWARRVLAIALGEQLAPAAAEWTGEHDPDVAHIP